MSYLKYVCVFSISSYACILCGPSRGWLRSTNVCVVLAPCADAVLCDHHLQPPQELRVFLSAEGELEASHVWSSLLPPPKVCEAGEGV